MQCSNSLYDHQGWTLRHHIASSSCVYQNLCKSLVYEEFFVVSRAKRQTDTDETNATDPNVSERRNSYSSNFGIVMPLDISYFFILHLCDAALGFTIY